MDIGYRLAGLILSLILLIGVFGVAYNELALHSGGLVGSVAGWQSGWNDIVRVIVLSMGLNGSSVSGSGVGDYRFMVDYNGSFYRLISGFDGSIVSASASPLTVLQSSLNGLTSGRVWKETVVWKGDFVVSSTIFVPSYTRIVLEGRLKLGDASDVSIISNANVTTGGNTAIELCGGFYDGNKANQVGETCSSLYFANCSDLKITGVTSYGSERYGVRVGSGQLAAVNDGNSFVVLSDCVFFNNSWDDVVLSCAGVVKGCSFYPSVSSNFLSLVCAKGVTVSGNFFYGQQNGAGYGFACEYGCSNNTVMGNSFFNCSFGVNLSTHFESSNVVSGNVMSCFGSVGVCAINVNGTDNIVADNVISGYANATVDGWGVYFNHGAERNLVSGNHISECKYSFVFEPEAVGNVLSQNILYNDPYGVSLSTGSNHFFGNVGFVTEGFGVVTNSTATSFSISHGLSGVPSVVFCSFNSTQVNAFKWTSTSSTITVTVVNSATSDQVVA
jgi:hypothetical protein